jgi:hypothetical protein
MMDADNYCGGCGKDVAECGCEPSAVSGGYAVGDKVRLLKDIYDFGDDNHHPPGYLAMKGEILEVRDVRKINLAISHPQITDNAFIVDFGEVEKA